MATVTIDGQPVEVPDNVGAFVAKLEDSLTAKDTALADTTKAIEGKLTELEAQHTKDAEQIQGLEAQVKELEGAAAAAGPAASEKDKQVADLKAQVNELTAELDAAQKAAAGAPNAKDLEADAAAINDKIDYAVKQAEAALAQQLHEIIRGVNIGGANHESWLRSVFAKIDKAHVQPRDPDKTT